MRMLWLGRTVVETSIILTSRLLFIDSPGLIMHRSLEAESLLYINVYIRPHKSDPDHDGHEVCTHYG